MKHRLRLGSSALLFGAAAACDFSAYRAPESVDTPGGEWPPADVETAPGDPMPADSAPGDPALSPANDGPMVAGDPVARNGGDTELLCGNGVLDEGEECDGTDFESATCTSLGFDNGALRCTLDCTFDTSSCTCSGSEQPCPGGCASVLIDSLNCGGCGKLCDVAQICVVGSCREETAAWRDVSTAGTRPPPWRISAEAAHDMTVGNGRLWVVYGSTGDDLLSVHWLSNGSWVAGIDPSSSDTAFSIPAVAISVGIANDGGGAVRRLAFLGTPRGGTSPAVVLLQHDGISWSSGASAAIRCDEPAFVDLAWDGVSSHVLVSGIDPCRLEYSWYAGTWHAPIGSLPLSSGRGAVVSAAEPTLAGGVANGEHYFTSFASNAFEPLTELSEGGLNALGENLDMTFSADIGLTFAWTEWNGIRYEIQAARWDGSSLSHLGTGAASGSAYANSPSVTTIDGLVWIAYVVQTSDRSEIHVRYFEPSSRTWINVASPLNTDPYADGHDPIIVGYGGLPHVAWREGPQGGSQALFVRTFP